MAREVFSLSLVLGCFAYATADGVVHVGASKRPRMRCRTPARIDAAVHR